MQIFCGLNKRAFCMFRKESLACKISCTDYRQVNLGTRLGPLYKIRIGHEEEDRNSGWFLEKVKNDFFSSAWLCQQSYCHGTGVRHPSVRLSVNSSFSETAAWIQAKFYGKLPIHHISRQFFLFFQIFFSFLLTWDPMGAKISKLLLLQFSSDLSQILS